MATVAQPTSISNGTQVQESDQHAEHGPPRFTAVNGKETTALQDPSTQPMTANQSQSREAADYVGIDGNTNSSRLEESQYEPSNAGKENTDEYDSQESLSPTTPGGANKNKRKRSESIERHSYQQDHLRLGGDTTGIPARVVPDDNPELSMQQEAINSTKLLDANVDYSGPPPTGYSHTEVKEDQAINGASGSWQDYDSHLISQAQKAQTLDTSDAQLVEALQRETHSTESVEQKSWVTGPTSASGESDQRSAQPYSQEKPQVAVQIGPKRKRVFSNRTKTGCLTCRRRKKKCDEQHPACNNCIRGGFVCEGYSSRSTWQKPSSSKTPVPLQSKEGYTDAPNHYMQDVGGRHHERAPTTAQQSEVNKARAVVAEENDGSGVQYLGGSANVAGNRNSWPKRSWPGASHPPYLADHMAKPEYREVPPIHELSREGQQPKAEYHVVPSIRELSQQQGSHAKPGMPIFQSPVDQRPPHPSPLDTSSPQAQARLALSIEHQLSARHNAGEDTERDKMVHGELYRPFDMQLVEDRDRCKSALWRFNNACSPQSGISSKEQNRLLREVIIPPVANSPSGSPISRPSGSIGPGVIVEAPFRCHYGFNIHIGEDVMISENCSMIDDCPINIGAHTWIGPNVTILGSMAHANMQERKGSQSRYQGRPVTIEEDCYVGANCTIYPGVRLRRGAYVAPGEVVKSDIVAYGFQGLKPSYM